MGAHEISEPFAQASRLIGHVVDFSRKSLGPDPFEYIGRHEPRLLEPVQQTFAVLDPVNWRIDRSRNRIQEIEAQSVGDEDRRGMIHG